MVAVIDDDDLHKVFAFNGSIDDPVTATSGAPETFEFQTKWVAHAVRRTGDVIDRLQDGRRRPLLESIEVAPRGRHDLDPPTARGHPWRRLSRRSSSGTVRLRNCELSMASSGTRAQPPSAASAAL